jgi:hypothetical protein
MRTNAHERAHARMHACTRAHFSKAQFGNPVHRVIMNPSSDDDEFQGSGSDGGGADVRGEPAEGPLRPKRYQELPVQEFCDCILLRTGIELTESGVTLKTHQLHQELFEVYHARLDNAVAFPRPDELLHPHKLLACTAFKTQKEWDAFKARAKHGLGKASVTNPTAGALTKAEIEYAGKKWEKYKLLKRDIHDSTQRLWVGLVPNNVLPSGIQQIKDLVEELRKQMFDVWKFKVTSGSRTRYADQQMTGACLKWRPTWWKIWKLMGPASSKCSATFMSEIGVKAPQQVEQMPGALPDAFGAQGEHLLGSTAANFPLQSKRALQLEQKTMRDREAAQMTSHMTSVTPVATTPDAAVFSQSRVRAMDTKSLLDVRKHEIQRLTFLRDSEHSTDAEKETYSLQLFKFMQAPIMPSSSFSPGFNPSSTPSSSFASSTSTSTFAHLTQSTSNLSMLDAAAGFRPVLPVSFGNINVEFAAMSTTVPRDDNQSFDQSQIEDEIQHGGADNFDIAGDGSHADNSFFVSDMPMSPSNILDNDGDELDDSDSVTVNMPDLESDCLSPIVSQSEWLDCIGKSWQVQKFLAGPDSFFSAAANWINLKLLASDPNLKLSAQSVRNQIALKIQMQKGRFDDLTDEDQFNDDGKIVVNCGKGERDDYQEYSLQAYCNGVRNDLPAGAIELQCMAMIWNVKVHVYSRMFERDTYGCKGSINECKMIRLSPDSLSPEKTPFEEYCVIVNDVPMKLSKEETYAQVYRQLPIWNTDIQVAHISDEIGRGIIALRPFRKGDVLGIYDGDRCEY